MSEQSNGRSGGIGFCGLLAIVFITLKLCKVIDWSWWWVLSPIWIPFAVIGTILLVVAAAIVINHFYETWRKGQS